MRSELTPTEYLVLEQIRMYILERGSPPLRSDLRALLKPKGYGNSHLSNLIKNLFTKDMLDRKSDFLILTKKADDVFRINSQAADPSASSM